MKKAIKMVFSVLALTAIIGFVAVQTNDVNQASDPGTGVKP